MHEHLIERTKKLQGILLKQRPKNPKNHLVLKWKMASTASLTKGKHINPSVRNLNEKVYRKNSRKGKLETKITANCKINQANCNEFIKLSNKVFMVTGSREKS